MHTYICVCGCILQILSCYRLLVVVITKSYPTFVTSWTAAHQAPLSMGFPGQEYWSGCHFLLQGL